MKDCPDVGHQLGGCCGECWGTARLALGDDTYRLAIRFDQGADMALTDNTSALPGFAARAGTTGTSPEQRMNQFHTERLTGPMTHPFDERRSVEDRSTRYRGSSNEEPEAQDDTALKAARAEAVEFVVKAFAAVDKNIALADKARLSQEKNQAMTAKMRLDAEKALAAALQMREEAERDLTDARARSEKIVADARAESGQLLEAARARCQAESEIARRQLTEALAPLRDLVGQAGATIDAFVKSAAEKDATETIDVRDTAVTGARDTSQAGEPHLRVLVSPIEDN